MRKRATRAAVGTALLLGSVAVGAAPAADLTPFEASYTWSWRGATVAVSTLKLERRDDNNWVYSSTNEARGIGYLFPYRPALQSILRVTDDGVEPQSFHAEGAGSSHNADVRFDWQSARASGTYEGVAVDMPIRPGVQDDLSVQIELITDLLRGTTPPTLQMIDKNSVREYRYQREGEATIDTPLGSIATVVYTSQHPGSPRVTRFWCAPSKGYLPMRVEQKRLDKVEWTMQIKSLKR